MKTSASIHTFTNVSNADSMVTDVSSLVWFERETPPITEPVKNNSQDIKMTSLPQNHHCKLDNRYGEATGVEDAKLKSCILMAASLSPTPSDNSSYCKMSDSDAVSKADHSSNSSTTSSISSTPDKSNDHAGSSQSLKIRLKDKGKESIFASTQDLSCGSNNSVFLNANGSRQRLTDPVIFGKNELYFYQNENENIEIDFCDIDMNTEPKLAEKEPVF